MGDYNATGSEVCDKGVVVSLFQENTFTLMDSFIELYQNSDDAHSKNISFKIIWTLYFHRISGFYRTRVIFLWSTKSPAFIR